MRLIDLHTHTTASDGSYTPAELVSMAADAGLSAIAITDHDTVAGNAEALEAGPPCGVEVVPGVEISVNHGGPSYHVLGYFIDYEHEPLLSSLESIRRFRDERNHKIVAKLNELGMSVTLTEIDAEARGESVGRPHVAAVLLRKGYVADTQEAFDKYLAKGKPAYIDRDRLSAADGIDLIRNAGGVAVFAHPGIYGWGEPGDLRRTVAEFAEMGIVGLEAYYSEHMPEDERSILALADEFGLVVTGGTDFHGTAKPEFELGRGTGNLAVPYELLEALKDRLGNRVEA
ncbi:MAG: PHP domain-containing protein [Candidatus Coatesbacteria bacterium]|nr:MAG: PHP domain-containing protein [Candidatus Coatesbacteria bacterium]